MKQFYFEYIPGILSAKSNISRFNWSFGTKVPYATKEKYEGCKLHIDLQVVPDCEVLLHTDINKFCCDFRFFKINPTENSVVYDRWIKNTVHLVYHLKMESDNIRVVVGQTYWRVVKQKFMNIHSMKYILLDMVTVLMLCNGLCPIYCSAVSKRDGEGSIFLAAPNTGKSLTALKLCSEHIELSMITEDLAVTDGHRLWGVPYSNSFRNYHDKKLKGREKKIRKTNSATINHVFFLDKADKPSSWPKERNAEKMMCLNNYLIAYASSPVLRALCYYHPEYDIENLRRTELGIHEMIMSHADCNSIACQNSESFADKVYIKIK